MPLSEGPVPAVPSIEWHWAQPRRWKSILPASAGGSALRKLAASLSHASESSRVWTTPVDSKFECSSPQYSVHSRS